jgi:hypothetical protein
MLCPRCYGKRIVSLDGSQVPCPECAGYGEVHCCDGLNDQPECLVAPSRIATPTRSEAASREPCQTTS